MTLLHLTTTYQVQGLFGSVRHKRLGYARYVLGRSGLGAEGGTVGREEVFSHGGDNDEDSTA